MLDRVSNWTAYLADIGEAEIISLSTNQVAQIVCPKFSVYTAINKVKEGIMRISGIAVIVAGVVWLTIALNMKTTIDIPSQVLFGQQISGLTVHNMEKADARRTQIILGSVVFIAGILLYGFSFSNQSTKEKEGESNSYSTDTRKCPFCAETVKSEAIICRYCQKELPPMDNTELHDIEVPAGMKLCPNCRTENDEASPVCQRCHAWIAG